MEWGKRMVVALVAVPGEETTAGALLEAVEKLSGEEALELADGGAGDVVYDEALRAMSEESRLNGRWPTYPELARAARKVLTRAVGEVLVRKDRADVAYEDVCDQVFAIAGGLCHEGGDAPTEGYGLVSALRDAPPGRRRGSSRTPAPVVRPQVESDLLILGLAPQRGGPVVAALEHLVQLLP